jgi:hypothetical protein
MSLIEGQQSGSLHEERSHARMLESMRKNYVLVFFYYPGIFFVNLLYGSPLPFPNPMDPNIYALLQDSILILMLITAHIWSFRLNWQYQTFHLNTSYRDNCLRAVYRYEWLDDLTEMRREWEALGYSRSRIWSLTFRCYRWMAWAWGQDIITQSPIYDIWCEIQGFVKFRF